MIIDLILINVIVTMIFLSGFIDSLDEAISGRWRFHHLPKPFSCNLCSVWWASVIYVAVTGQLSLLSVALCLLSAYLTEVTAPLITTVRNYLLKAIELLNRPIM